MNGGAVNDIARPSDIKRYYPPRYKYAPGARYKYATGTRYKFAPDYKNIYIKIINKNKYVAVYQR